MIKDYLSNESISISTNDDKLIGQITNFVDDNCLWIKTNEGDAAILWDNIKYIQKIKKEEQEYVDKKRSLNEEIP